MFQMPGQSQGLPDGVGDRPTESARCAGGCKRGRRWNGRTLPSSISSVGLWRCEGLTEVRCGGRGSWFVGTKGVGGMGGTTAPWHTAIRKSLHDSKNKDIGPAVKFVSLATVRDGKPRCRTVVFRGFLEHSDTVTFVTDARSAKVEDVRSNDSVEMCWYFAGTREQYRLHGTCKIVDSAEQDAALAGARQKAWMNMSDDARTQFAWPAPGTRRDDSGAFVVERGEVHIDKPLDTFCLMLMDVQEVDYVALFENKRKVFRREIGELGKGWREEDVNP
ncbi:unnamed protein product [Pedinophyceae sp. YPF-701]|nr:unnamed protein product [Pedinophyceae sp. YPF-701]